MEALSLYLFLVNALGFILMLADKQKAKKNKWRIREATFFAVAAIGGSIGVYLGMYTFRHKTRHPTFTVGIPAIMICQFLLIAVIFQLI